MQDMKTILIPRNYHNVFIYLHQLFCLQSVQLVPPPELVISVLSHKVANMQRFTYPTGIPFCHHQQLTASILIHIARLKNHLNIFWRPLVSPLLSFTRILYPLKCPAAHLSDVAHQQRCSFNSSVFLVPKEASQK